MSMVVRSEEELVARIHAAHVTRWCISFTGNECPEAKQIARALLEDGTVTVAPSLVAESREAVARYFFKRRTHLPDEDFDYLLERERRGRDGVPELIWAEADALLALGGPVRLADATPEQGWCRAVEYLGSLLGAVRDADMDAALLANPYDGFIRREQNGGE